MELKDVILSTLAEIGEEPLEKEMNKEMADAPAGEAKTHTPAPAAQMQPLAEMSDLARFVGEEREFLERMRERLLVLFEGFQSPNNKAVEAKIDLTLNFLEYMLATLDERIEALKKA
jgi:uncharacterized coiled-coil protein SlyX